MIPSTSRVRFSVSTTLILLLSAFSGLARPAENEAYRLDPVHTRILLTVSHAGFSKAIGTVSGSTGTLVFNPENWNASKLDVTIPMQHIDFGDAKWNEAVMGKKLLNVETYPAAHYVLTRVEPIETQHATVIGVLTLRGVAREVKLEVVLNALKRHPMPPFRRTIGFSASTRINRSDFGIRALPGMIGDEVELRLEVEAIRTRADLDLPDAAVLQVDADALHTDLDSTIEPMPKKTP